MPAPALNQAILARLQVRRRPHSTRISHLAQGIRLRCWPRAGRVCEILTCKQVLPLRVLVLFRRQISISWSRTRVSPTFSGTSVCEGGWLGPRQSVNAGRGHSMSAMRSEFLASFVAVGEGEDFMRLRRQARTKRLPALTTYLLCAE